MIDPNFEVVVLNSSNYRFTVLVYGGRGIGNRKYDFWSMGKIHCTIFVTRLKVVTSESF